MKENKWVADKLQRALQLKREIEPRIVGDREARSLKAKLCGGCGMGRKSGVVRVCSGAVKGTEHSVPVYKINYLS